MQRNHLAIKALSAPQCNTAALLPTLVLGAVGRAAICSQKSSLADSHHLLALVQSKASGQVKDLLNRLNNAVKQRNAAREEALLASQNLKKLEEDIESGALQPAAAAAAAAQPPLPATPSALAAVAGSPLSADSGGCTLWLRLRLLSRSLTRFASVLT